MTQFFQQPFFTPLHFHNHSVFLLGAAANLNSFSFGLTPSGNVTGFIFAVAATFALAVIFWLVVDLRMKWKSIFGKGGLPEGKLLEDLLRRVSSGEAKINNFEDRVVELERMGKISIQKVGFLRFNPFSSTGGDQSFSLALLDGEQNGVIISSLYSREGTRIYAKEVMAGKPMQALSEEEQKVLGEAIRNNS